MPALNPSSQNTRLSPQAPLPATVPASPATTATPSTPGITIPGLSQITSVLGGIGNLFTQAGTIFSYFGIIGGWIANPIRIVKMVVGVVLVAEGFHQLNVQEDKSDHKAAAKTRAKRKSKGKSEHESKQSLTSSFVHGAASSAGGVAGGAAARKVGKFIRKAGAPKAKGGSTASSSATTAEEEAVVAA